jgi:mannose-6-phosphate isomerase-like protein (cupin superfamily)
LFYLIAEAGKAVWEAAGEARLSAYAEFESDQRPWGDWAVVALGERYVVKRLRIVPGASISLQRHRWRDEHWVIVNGVADVALGDMTRRLGENEAIFIPAGETHRLGNPGTSDLVVIEVQHGARLEEGDIERLDDRYGRA